MGAEKTIRQLGRQRGVALAISLVLLVALTILGLATMTGSRLNEKMASNQQQKAIAFEVAESAINSVWTVGDINDAIDLIPPSQINDPDPIFPVLANATLTGGTYDQEGDNTVNFSVAEVSVQYCGEQINPVGSSINADESTIQYVQLLFNVNGNAEIEGSHARAEHVQRGSLTRVQTGRTGACINPGI